MSFHRTGRTRTYEEEERFQYCDQCDKQLSIDRFTSVCHWDVTFDPRISYPDDDYESFSFCSFACIAAWAIDGKQRRSSGPKHRGIPPPTQ